MILRSSIAFYIVATSFFGSPTFCNGADTVTGTLNPLDLKGQRTVVAFNEIPPANTPFTIGAAAFSGQGVILNSAFLNAPSGSPVLSSQSNPTDVIQVDFDSPVKSVGAYVNVAGQATVADFHLELYAGNSLLANLDLSDFTSQTTTFFGGFTDSPVITRAIFRNAITNGVSFLLDDVTFTVPEPSSVSLVGAFALALTTQRRNWKRQPS